MCVERTHDARSMSGARSQRSGVDQRMIHDHRQRAENSRRARDARRERLSSQDVGKNISSVQCGGACRARGDEGSGGRARAQSCRCCRAFQRTHRRRGIAVSSGARRRQGHPGGQQDVALGRRPRRAGKWEGTFPVERQLFLGFWGHLGCQGIAAGSHSGALPAAVRARRGWRWQGVRRTLCRFHVG